MITPKRIWRAAGLRPHRLERHMASNDPPFESKAADIIGLYLHPPQHAALFCIDEKSAKSSFRSWSKCLGRLDRVNNT